MRWWWPSSLAGQLALVLVLAAVLGQLASFLIAADERRFALEGVEREQVVARVIMVTQLVSVTPPELHGAIAEASSTPQTRLWLAEAPVVGEAEDQNGRWLRRLLERELGPRASSVRIRREWDEAGIWRPWRHHAEEGGMGHPRPFGGMGGGMHWPDMRELEISVRLAGGGWLNARGDFRPVPLAPDRSATVSALATAAFTIAVALVMVRRITRPLRALATSADAFGRGESPPPLPVRGPVEVRRTAQAFNLMRERLRRFVADRTRMLAAVGHDLRTPITSLRLRAEFVGDEETRTRILETLDEMQRMVEATLTFTREETSSEETRVVDLGALVESVCADLVDLGREVEVSVGERVTLPCRPVGLKRAVRNLVENAVAYGSRARVAIQCLRRQRVAVTIDDDGPGIPEAELERVFEPFTRLEPSRSALTGGMGLGLAIARTIARAHGGDIRLANRPGGGLRATLTLPLPGADVAASGRP